MIELFTDGACSGNPGWGGWGAVLRCGSRHREIAGAAADTTNNRMELQAAIAALGALTAPSRVRLHTDSTYVREGMTRWLRNWKANGWRTAARRPVRNRDLWQQLDAAAAVHDVEWVWVRGHAGHPENERADALAGRALRQARGSAGGGAPQGDEPRPGRPRCPPGTPAPG